MLQYGTGEAPTAKREAAPNRVALARALIKGMVRPIRRPRITNSLRLASLIALYTCPQQEPRAAFFCTVRVMRLAGPDLKSGSGRIFFSLLINSPSQVEPFGNMFVFPGRFRYYSNLFFVYCQWLPSLAWIHRVHLV